MTAELIKNLPAKDYHAAEGLNFSMLKFLHVGPPARFKYERDNRVDKSTPAMVLGSAIHCHVLEEHLDSFVNGFAFKPYKGTLKKDDAEKFLAEKEAFAEFKASLGARQALPHGSKGTVFGVKKAIKKHHADWLAHFDLREVSIFWDDADFGCRCKARIDGLNSKTGAFMDLKTTGKTVQKFSRSMEEFDYVIQAAFYARAIAQLPDMEPTAFAWLVVETSPPYISQQLSIERADLELATAKVQSLAHDFSYYSECDDWPTCTPDTARIWPSYWEKGGRESS